MTNYIIEDSDFDFFKELSNVSKDNENIVNQCFLSNEPLSYNSITLDCKHTFNYNPLYKEIYTAKYILNTQSRYSSFIKCPYCRTITNKLLPYIPLDDCKQKLVGVNRPIEFCQKIHDCSWKFINGKNKGKCCKKTAYETNDGVFCFTHHKLVSKRNKTKNIPFSSKMETYLKAHKVSQLKDKLRKAGLQVGGVKKELVLRLC